MSDREDAEVLLQIDNAIWRKFGFRSGTMVEQKWPQYLEAVKNSTPYFVRRGVVEIIEDENHHSFLRALQQLGRWE